MTLSDLEFKHSYKHSRGDRPIQDFLIPALAKSVLYQRASGYFSSGILAQLAPGIAQLIQNGGKMQLLTSHKFTPKDKSAVESLGANPDFHRELVDSFNESFENLASEIERHNVRALLWMLERNLLEIKVVVPKSRYLGGRDVDISMYHPKFGILTDSSGEQVGFAGSLNETVNGWFHNIENMSVFTSKDPMQASYLKDYVEDFHSYWSEAPLEDWVVTSLPNAVAKSLIETNGTEEPTTRTGSSPDSRAVEKGKSLRPYQQDAIDSWIAADKVGLLSMATGTGKTFTALKCIEACLEEEPDLLTVLIAPFQHIADQWAKELATLRPIDLSTESSWRETLEDLHNSMVLKRVRSATLIVVKNTAGSASFESAITRLSEVSSRFLLVVDEVHWLGAPSFRPGLHNSANWRLGLSATPKRYMDEEGSDAIFQYFTSPKTQKPVAFSFPISKALKYIDPVSGNPILTPYKYKPVFLELTEDEQADYAERTKSIARFANRELSSDEFRQLKIAANQRALILKKAKNKIPELKRLIDLQGLNSLDMSLVYCSESDQMRRVGELLFSLGVDYQRITVSEGARAERSRGGKSEREEILEAFSRGRYRTLLSIDCLDEGVDIPAARTGFILASSGNSREFIQRRGILMRTFPGKELAEIYDFVAVPFGGLNTDESFKSEIVRMQEFAQDAANRDEILESISDRFGTVEAGGLNE